MEFEFNSNPGPTLGVEVELQLVDRETRALTSAAAEIIDSFGEVDWLKKELLQSTIEINSDVCADIGEVEADLGGKLEQDLNVPGALGVMFELVRCLNTAMDDGDLGPPDAQLVLPVFERFDAVLGVMALRRAEEAAPDVPVDKIEELIADRKAARARRDFAAADDIRDDLDTRGVILEDTVAGTRWKRK